ncbi:unnamed protein product [Rangifer tarandus platyrhynchus]|uniref:Uncharacterized protein n=2 Tax=Rangifer tarandus platyrhynchus TaxID=3082113 RepID=A0ABN8YZ92_RANTA|nr:unnamed protein product [Rangifer tarandus platyrhynchus]CAI9693666.1 unnamed protein product [Rangifer tarandus platyrhynchus]
MAPRVTAAHLCSRVAVSAEVLSPGPRGAGQVVAETLRTCEAGAGRGPRQATGSHLRSQPKRGLCRLLLTRSRVCWKRPWAPAALRVLGEWFPWTGGAWDAKQASGSARTTHHRASTRCYVLSRQGAVLAGRPAGRSAQRVPPPELPGAAVTRHPECAALTSGGRKPEVTVSTGPCLLGSLRGSFFALRLAPGGPGGPGRSSAHRRAPALCRLLAPAACVSLRQHQTAPS